MATQKAITGNVYKNNGGTFLNAGATRGKVVTTTFTFTKYAVGNSSVNRVPESVYGQAADALAPYQYNARYILTQGYLPYFGSLTNTGVQFLLSSKVPNPIHRKQAFRTLRRRTAGWNYATGAFLTAPTAANDTMESIDNSSTIDTVTYPTRAIPGEFAYQYGSWAPKRTTYRAKTG